jgi:hypothetical protein
VEHDRHVAGGALQVDLDGVALAHGRSDRGSAVLDDAARGIVETAMSDRPFQPVKHGHEVSLVRELVYGKNRVDLDCGV